MNSIYIGIAGMFGALSRYAVSLVWSPVELGCFPWGTLGCNWLGSLMLGFIGFAALKRLSARLRLAVAAGFIGSFTTFSALTYETMQLMRSGQGFQALSYVLLSLWGGLLCAWLGARIARLAPPGRGSA